MLARARGYWEFEFVFTGRARPTGVDCPPPPLEKPRLYISHPNSPHGWTDDADGVSEIFVIQFQSVPEELAEIVTPAGPLQIELHDSDRHGLKLRLQDAWNASSDKDAHASLKLHQLLFDIAALAISRLKQKEWRIEPADKINRTLHWFEENLGENPTVEEAAREIGVSTAHLRRLFSDAGRPSPRAELARLKTEAAQRCLCAGWTQEAIAQFLGFSEASSFARAFYNVCGRYPGEWLKKTQSNKGKRHTGAT
ncbi:MAG TPA: AraC family transcriptional regulator [Rariglobus sp.]|nr:AraC family transcriptional regulator [Rariglobus sp.]